MWGVVTRHTWIYLAQVWVLGTGALRLAGGGGGGGTALLSFCLSCLGLTLS